MSTLRLYKREKLCSQTAIDTLFPQGRNHHPDAGTHSVMAFPWRAVWRINPRRTNDVPQFLISVPKKRLHHAVDRVQMRRRMREAYRLNRQLIPDCNADIAMIYVADRCLPFDDCRRSVRKILSKICQTISSEKQGEQSHQPSAGC